VTCANIIISFSGQSKIDYQIAAFLRRALIVLRKDRIPGAFNEDVQLYFIVIS